MRTLMEIFNSHVDADKQITSYEHPGNHMLNGALIHAIVDDVVAAIRSNDLRTDDLHFRINYNKPGSSSGNTKLRGVVYVASHPLFDCYLDGLDRQKPSCSGLDHWCYVFSDFFYKSYGKQISMMANSILYIMEPERAEVEIQAWIDLNKDKIVRDRNGHIPFRTDEAGDVTYCLPMWLRRARNNPDINFYAYTKQFDLLNGLDYCINKAFPNFRILLSDSTKTDANPISKVREDYGKFAILFKDKDLTPDDVIALAKLATFNLHRCPGVKMGCFYCTKCSEPETPNTKVIVADEH